MVLKLSYNDKDIGQKRFKTMASAVVYEKYVNFSWSHVKISQSHVDLSHICICHVTRLQYLPCKIGSKIVPQQKKGPSIVKKNWPSTTFFLIKPGLIKP